MSLFDQYAKETEITFVNEGGEIISLKKALSKEMEHLQKLVHIFPGKGNWANSALSSIVTAHKAVKDMNNQTKEKAFIDINKTVDEQYINAIGKVYADNPGKKHIFDATKPAIYTYDFLMNLDAVRTYIVNNIADKNFLPSVENAYLQAKQDLAALGIK
ncbi:MAG: hypothetical protein IKR19_08410 [Acholeplasmatales bacterium]|nr:hypothetical protein [Acholeplasmatales bacterium]